MDDNSPQKLSTSALAKLLDVPSQQLFSTLKDYGWIRKLEEGWELTSKGEFEGGEYVHSKKYGRYIVWPQELAEHPLFQALEDNRHITATVLGKSAGINAREVNRILSELAWIRHGFQGWELTALGEEQGGVQLENESSGTFYVVWPQAILQNELLNTQLKHTASVFSNDEQEGTEKDLFAGTAEYTSIDGHVHQHKSQLQICHWLYMAGIAHACKRRLPSNEELIADFYLPAYHLYIECWGGGNSSDLAQKLKRKEFYQSSGLEVIDIEQNDLKNLDEVLTRKLRQHGIRVY